MSRMYHVSVHVRGISYENLCKAMGHTSIWHRAVLCEDFKPGMCFVFRHWLCGRQTEKSEHKKIVNTLKAKAPGVQVFTRWTCLDTAPYIQYGESFDAAEKSAKSSTRPRHEE